MKEFELEPDEHVVVKARKHWLLFVLQLLPYAILAILPFALIPLVSLVPGAGAYASLVDFSSPLGRAALGVWLLMVWTGAWSAFTRYFLNLWVLTNERIVEIDQPAYFRREVSSLLLDRVQDVTTEISGILPSLLDIGTITVQSAGAVNEFRMTGIPRPQQMRDLILKYVPEGEKPKVP